MKRVRVILSEEAEEAYKYLNDHASESKIENSILNSINKKVELIRVNPHYGDPISKKLIPKEYVEKYGGVYIRGFLSMSNHPDKGALSSKYAHVIFLGGIFVLLPKAMA